MPSCGSQDVKQSSLAPEHTILSTSSEKLGKRQLSERLEHNVCGVLRVAWSPGNPRDPIPTWEWWAWLEEACWLHWRVGHASGWSETGLLGVVL